MGESVLVRDRVMLLLIRFVGENEGNDVDLQPLHNGGSPIILRGEAPPIPPHHHPALFLPLSCLNSLAATLNSFIPSVMGLFKAFPCHVILRVVTLTTLLVAKSHWLHLFRPTFSPAAAP